MNASERQIAIARITGPQDRKGFFPVTIGGDGLSSLELPFSANLYQPTYRGSESNKILATATDGPEPNAKFIKVDVVAVQQRGKKARIQLQGTDIPVELAGFWICILASQLTVADDEYYFFEMQDLPVYKVADGEIVGQIKECFQTSAHGVLEIELNESDIRPMVPMIGQFVNFTEGRTGVIIPDLDDFCIED